MSSKVWIEPRRKVGTRDPKIYGQFIEHFHRQIYGGVFDPGSRLSDTTGLREDVIAATAKISPAVVRWPGGCFVSAYHWEDGIGEPRQPHFDKAWRVEDSNAFGTDEFVRFCRATGSEPYICTNAGTGTLEEMSNWVEYCNLPDQGAWAKRRVANGHKTPFNVKYWSIGNENYGDWEIGAHAASDWCRIVKEAGKMMKAVDPAIEISAASVSDVDWDLNLLREAGNLLDWISIHGYWDPLWEENALAPYETCMVHSLRIEEKIRKTEHILGAVGYLGKIRIAFDEWNLRGWHHPNRNAAGADYLVSRDKNDLNESYTMADAVFAACFLNQCLKHCAIVGMANFAPLVNTRGAIFTHADGVVLRSTYYVFELFTAFMGDVVIDTWLDSGERFEAEATNRTVEVPSLDSVATTMSRGGGIQVSLVNRHPDKTIEVEVVTADLEQYSQRVLHRIAPESKDSYNDVGNPDAVTIETQSVERGRGDRLKVELLPHSVNVLNLSVGRN